MIVKIFNQFSKYFLLLLLLFSICSQSFAQNKNNNLWKDINESKIVTKGERYIYPNYYRTVHLETELFYNLLLRVPMEGTTNNENNEVVIQLPYPDGTFENFKVYESPIMAPELAKKFPELKTYSVQSTRNVFASGRIDYTPLGFHAILFTDKGTIFIDPIQKGDIENYLVYFKKDFVKQNSPDLNHSCVVEDEEIQKEIQSILKTRKVKLFDDQLRTYRLAMAATGEYTAFYGGTVAGGMNGIVTTMNRVNGVYIKDLSIKMILVANNDLLVYTNASTDPYTNNNGNTMLGQNQTNIDNVIGSANYDIGHVFSTGGGGIAYLGCVCRATLKARGVTGSPSPIGDPFDIDYVAHEMGHQYGANHTFNGEGGSCGGGNRNSTTAYEPGSGSTIMAYAGICTGMDLQNNSDDYFHLISLNEIIAYTNYSYGNSCPVITSTGNLSPSVSVGPGGFTIPINTPFSLTGSATDPNNDILTYCWEEYDLGPAGAPNNPSGNAPIFRSFTPTTLPTRIFPRLSNLLNNTSVIGELLPSYTRNLTFALTARDNKVTGGLVGYATIQFSVTSAAGPFLVTYPNTNVSVPALSSQTVTWSVANTNNSPVNCANVNILLSTDGGQTFPIVLASNIPNDGSETIVIPNILTTTARIKVEAEANIFFDVSNVNFTIEAPVPVELTSFYVVNDGNGVKLLWETVTETNNYGFEIERRKENSNFQKIAFVPGNGTTLEKHFYNFVDKSTNGGKYSYRLKQLDIDGKFKYSDIVEINLGLPKDFVLEQNHPNPFNPITNIKFSLNTSADVKLGVYNQLGQQVAVVLNEHKEAGTYSINFDASALTSGIYYYKIIALQPMSGEVLFQKSKKMVLLK